MPALIVRQAGLVTGHGSANKELLPVKSLQMVRSVHLECRSRCCCNLQAVIAAWTALAGMHGLIISTHSLFFPSLQWFCLGKHNPTGSVNPCHASRWLVNISCSVCGAGYWNAVRLQAILHTHTAREKAGRD